MHDLTVIIPNFNGKHLLKQCFESLKIQNCAFDVIIVDNGSEDGSVEYIRHNYPEFKVLQNTENLGFSKAVNRGIKASDAEYVMLLNNDVVLEKDAIKTLLNCIKKDSKLFAVASKMLNGDKLTIDDAGDEYTLFGWTKKVGNGKSSAKYGEEREIFSACAGAAIYRRNLFNITGYFDEAFFAYMEDVDMSYRARIHGYKCGYCPDAVVYHLGSATSGSKYNRFKIKLAARNNVYVPYKNMPWPQLLLNLIFLIIGYFVKYLFFLRKGHGKDYLDGLKEGLNSLNRVSKVEYHGNRLSNYLSIEWYLIKNTVHSIWS